MSLAGTIDVIVPVRNEEECVRGFYERVSRIEQPLQLIFVDNASSDRTVEIVESFPGVIVIRHERDEGYGGSILDGIERSSAEAFVIIDVDCEYPPEIIPELVAALERSPAVYTSRFMGEQQPDMPLFRRLGNKAITAVFNVLFGQKLTDLYTGCKAIKKSALDGVTLRRKGFEHVLELAVRLSRNGVRIGEVPIIYEVRRTGRSKMKHVSETLKFCFLLIWYRLTG